MKDIFEMLALLVLVVVCTPFGWIGLMLLAAIFGVFPLPN